MASEKTKRISVREKDEKPFQDELIPPNASARLILQWRTWEEHPTDISI